MVVTECLHSSRQQVLVADIWHERGGELVVVTGQVGGFVRCHEIYLRLVREEVTVSVCSLSSFYVRSKTDSEQVSMLRLGKKEDSLCLVVCTGTPSASQVELWTLNKQPLTLKRAFQPAPTDTKLHTYHWTHQASVSHPSLPISLATANFPLRYHTQTDNKMFQYLAVAYRDGSIKLINKHTFQVGMS